MYMNKLKKMKVEEYTVHVPTYMFMWGKLKSFLIIDNNKPIDFR